MYNFKVKISFILVFTFIISIKQANTQHYSKPVLAVMPFKQNGFYDSDIDFIINLVSSVFVKTGKYKVLERWQIEAVLEEQKINLTGIVDEQLAIKAGKFLSANNVVIGYLNNRGDENRYIVYGILKLIDVKTSEIRRTVDIMFSGNYNDFIQYMRIKTYELAEAKPKSSLGSIPKFIFKTTTIVAFGASVYFGYQFYNYYQKYKLATDKYDMLNQKAKAKSNYKNLQYSGIACISSLALYWLSKKIFSDQAVAYFDYRNDMRNTQINLAVCFNIQ